MLIGPASARMPHALTAGRRVLTWRVLAGQGNPTFNELSKQQSEKGLKLAAPKLPGREAGGECNEKCESRRAVQMGIVGGAK